MVFTRAIVRQPGPSFVNGLTTANLGKPDFQKALSQHEAYVGALRSCGLDVRILPPDDDYPDSVFVEDTALLTPHCAIITRPGAPSRRGETEAIEAALRGFFPSLERVRSPGTVDAGDIMMAGTHFFIGLSERTNAEGARQVIRILEEYGMTGSTLPVKDALHLKSEVAYIENNTLVVSEAFSGRPEFSEFSRIEVVDNETYAANCLWLNGTVLTATGFPVTAEAIASRGYRVVSLDMSEFRKLDGGLSCLSLRF
jgi:dimethylargininase